jgi:D-tyrosyl-tRNA(Tyr) deacylase
MKIVLQRVKAASVSVDGRIHASIGRGLCLLVGIEKGDTSADVHYLVNKVAELRIFPDDAGRMNLSVLDIQGEVLAVSQFTLAGSVRKGRRPSFDKAEEPEKAEALLEEFVQQLQALGLRVQTGIFGAMMDVRLVNDGPVTFIVPSRVARDQLK